MNGLSGTQENQPATNEVKIMKKSTVAIICVIIAVFAVTVALSLQTAIHTAQKALNRVKHMLSQLAEPYITTVKDGFPCPAAVLSSTAKLKQWN